MYDNWTRTWLETFALNRSVCSQLSLLVYCKQVSYAQRATQGQLYQTKLNYTSLKIRSCIKYLTSKIHK